MSLQSRMDTVALFFYAPWCGPCKRVKPYYEETVKPIYTMNGITCHELNYDEPRTKAIMKNLGIRTVPTLCLMGMKTVIDNVDDFGKEMIGSHIVSKVCMDSKEIPLYALDKISTFCMDEDF